MKLFTYFRSSAAYRDGIVLNLKGYPMKRCPFIFCALAASRNRRTIGPSTRLAMHHLWHLTQSLVIIEWLDETYPQVPLLPADADNRALND